MCVQCVGKQVVSQPSAMMDGRPVNHSLNEPASHLTHTQRPQLPSRRNAEHELSYNHASS